MNFKIILLLLFSIYPLWGKEVVEVELDNFLNYYWILEEAQNEYLFLDDFDSVNHTLYINFKNIERNQLNSFIKYIKEEQEKYINVTEHSNILKEEIIKEKYQDYLIEYDNNFYFYNISNSTFNQFNDDIKYFYLLDLYSINHMIISPMGKIIQNNKSKYSFEINLDKDYCIIRSDTTLRLPRNTRLKTAYINNNKREIGINIDYLDYNNVTLYCNQNINESMIQDNLNNYFSTFNTIN